MRSLLAVAWLLLVLPVSASAHMKVVSPAPRSTRDDIKSGPCGGVAKGQPTLEITAGQQLKVDLLETIDHTGCYQVVLLDANDANPQIVAQKADPNDGPIADRQAGEPRDVVLTVPASTAPCENCTLQVRQIMLEDYPTKDCQPNQDIAGFPNDVYFACSDVRILAASADAGVPTDGGPSASSSGDAGTSGGGSSSGAAAVDGGNNTSGAIGASSGGAGGGGRGTAGELEDGCAVSPAGSGTLLALLVGAGFVVRRRRRDGSA